MSSGTATSTARMFKFDAGWAWNAGSSKE